MQGLAAHFQLFFSVCPCQAMFGINHGTLKEMCRQIGIDVSGDKGYDGLVRDYLIKVKVGH